MEGKKVIITKHIKKIKIKLSNTNIVVPVQVLNKSETKLLKKLFNKKLFLNVTKDVGKIISVKYGVARVSGLFNFVFKKMRFLGILKIKAIFFNILLFYSKKIFYTVAGLIFSLFYFLLKKFKDFFSTFSVNCYFFFF